MLPILVLCVQIFNRVLTVSKFSIPFLEFKGESLGNMVKPLKF